ncbi:HmuY family protein [Alteromonas antoniana]|uniref:HmuY family protein n=1 Tax=Alteromonas antoniana TaxID=2803813 RepID=UPI001C446A94|nr:HmuY family protein [Alteromonas antoniana]
MNKTYLALLLAISLGLTACGGSSDPDTSTTPPDSSEGDDSGEDTGDDGDSSDGNIEEGTVFGPFSTGSTSDPVAVYFDLDTQTEVSLTEEEAATDTTWDIAFKRTSVFVNTHQETPVSVYFTGNNADFYDDSGEPVADKFLNATPDSELEDYLAITAEDIPQADAFITDSESQVIGDSFYHYDMTTHVVSPADDVFYIVSSDDNYTKFHVTNIVTEGRGLGEITLEVMHQSAVDGQAEFAQPVDITLNAVGCVEPLFIDFDLQQAVTEADNWDVQIPCGDGAAEFAMLLADDATVLRTDGETHTGIDPEAAPFYGFSEDNVTDYAFDASPWYFYDSTSHLLHSQFGVYLIQTAGATFKLQITSYYDDAGTSGSYSFRADELVQE